MESNKIIKKITREQVTDEAILLLITEKQGYEVAVGENYYMLYPLPAEKYIILMGTFRQIWYELISYKEDKYAEAVSAAKALAQNMGEIDDRDVQDSVQSLLNTLAESKNVHPLEFLTHEKFSKEIKTVLDILVSGCDEVDIQSITIQQTARLLEVCFHQNFVPFIRLANSANRMFRGSN